MAIKRQAIVVSFAGGAPNSPRAQRARMIATAFERDLSLPVEQIPAPGRPYAVDAGIAPGATLPRRAALKLLSPFVLDQYEPGAFRLFRRWTPQGLGAVLIGWPFSPLFWAARRLVAAGVPYVLDVGDPWVLTPKEDTQEWGRLSGRLAGAESYLWEHAAGGVVTTAGQAEALGALFPRLQLLRRPNGYFDVRGDAPWPDPRPGPSRELRLVQFGSVYPVRLAIGDWLSRLRREGGFDRLHFVNYGASGAPELLESDDPGVVVEVRAPVELRETWLVARDFDAAVVTGNKDPAQLPSKAIQYLTLPIPRLGLTADDGHDELTRFAGNKPAFLAVDIRSADGPALALAHLRRPWSERELWPAVSESWPAAAREVVEFAVERWRESERGDDRAAMSNGAGAGSALDADRA